MIRLRTLGESIIEVDGVAYTPQFDTLFAALVYLTAERGRRVTRQTLAELLWPNQDLSRGRHCLRQLLYRMRVAGCPVEGGRDTLLLPESLVMPTFSAAPAAERLVAERAVGTLVIGPFLPGYAPPFSDAFTEWLERTRGAMDARVRRVLLEVVHAHKLRGEWDQVDTLAAEVLRIDPLNEEATFARVEATAMVGAKTEALAIIDRYSAELGPDRAQLQLPAAVLRKRIAERFPERRYGAASEQVFVGRADVMETLSTALLRARKSEGSGILLTGAPGVGKTRLVQELTRVAAMQGVRVVRSNIAESDADRPLAAFTDLVPQLRTLKGAIGVSPDSLTFLDRLTEEPVPTPSGRQDASDPRWIAARIRQAVVDLCDAVTTEHTVLVTIEDVHWLDTSSWAAVDALLEGIASKRLLLLLTSRGPHPTPATPLRCVERLSVLPVAGLEPAPALALARSIAADRDSALSHDAIHWCVSAGDGNPLFLRELVAHVLESGATESVPASIQGLLDARVSRLSATSRRVLEASVILGDFSTAELLSGVLELPAHELASALGELAREQLLSDNTTLISARHELVRRRVLHLMPEQVARILHRRAATILSASMAQAPTVESLLAAAMHWRNAKDANRAIATLACAASAVERLGAVADSARLLAAALQLATSSADRIQLSRRLLRCLAMSALWTSLLKVVEGLAAIPEWRADADGSAADQLVAIQARYRTGEDSRPLIEEAYQIASDATLAANTRVGAARLGVVIASNCGTHADQRRLWQTISSARLDPGVDRLEALTLDLIVEANTGDPQTALDRAERLRTLACEATDPMRRVKAMLNVAQAYHAVGLLENALHELSAVRTEAQRIGSADHESIATHRITALLIDLRIGNAARAWFDRLCQCVSRVSTTDSYLHRLGMTEDAARLALLESRVSEALELARDFYEEAHSLAHPMHWHLRDSVTLLAETLLHFSDDPIDDTIIAELEALCTLDRLSFTHDRTVAVLALALERSGRIAQAAHVVDSYLAHGRRSLAPWRSPSEIIGLLQPVRTDE
jgi:DNA-binding SARP family transcriptional activator